jgi:phosphatidylglycerophosphate synthase
MNVIWGAIQRGYLRLIEPLIEQLVKHRVSPNVITTLGTLCAVGSGVIFATGHIHAAGWFFGLTAFFDVVDGAVARRTGAATVFGAFYDSTLDRVADAGVLGGILVFFARETPYRSVPMVVLCLLAIVGAFLTSYTRARAEPLGIDAKVGIMQRPERITLIAAPAAFFGLALQGRVLQLVVVVLMLTSWITVVQRINFVRRASHTGAGGG